MIVELSGFGFGQFLIFWVKTVLATDLTAFEDDGRSRAFDALVATSGEVTFLVPVCDRELPAIDLSRCDALELRRI